MMSSWARARLVGTCLLVVCAAVGAAAQTLPAEPIVFADGHVTLGGDVSATVAPDDPGFFNYTDYEHSALRMARVDFIASVRLNGHFTALADIRVENGERPAPYGLYLRVRPWTNRNFDIQVGRVPSTFGAFPRRSYASDNFLIAYPLGYQYLASLRPDSLPATTTELMRMRGRGWLSRFSIGDQTAAHGLALASVYRLDTGVQAHGGNGVIELTGSVTNGSLSDPQVKDDNDGKNIAGRIVIHPLTGLVLGASGSSGAYVSKSIAADLPGVDIDSLKQNAFGADVEYSRGHYVVRAETVVNGWTLPSLATLQVSKLRAAATYVEGRYRLRPGLYVAARYDHLGFSDVEDGAGGQLPWDAPVTRIEVGGGYSIQRNLIAKLALQHNTRSAGRIHTANLVAAQLLFWF